MWTPLVAWLLPLTAAAQVVCSLGPGAASYKTSSDQPATADALELTAKVLAAEKTICGSNCPDVVLFRNPTAPNLLLVADAGRAKLVYAPQTFAAVYDAYGDDGIVALLAHALAHALDDAMGAAWIQKTWTPELRADAWAGCLLARLNPALDSMQPSLAALSKYPSPNHPALNVRLPVLRAGYLQCGGSGSRFDGRK